MGEMKEHTSNEFGCINKNYCPNQCTDEKNEPAILMRSQLASHRSVCPFELIPCTLCNGSLRTREHTKNLFVHMEQFVATTFQLKQSNINLKRENLSLKVQFQRMKVKLLQIEYQYDLEIASLKDSIIELKENDCELKIEVEKYLKAQNKSISSADRKKRTRQRKVENSDSNSDKNSNSDEEISPRKKRKFNSNSTSTSMNDSSCCTFVRSAFHVEQKVDAQHPDFSFW
jgi:hypothetical protein